MQRIPRDHHQDIVAIGSSGTYEYDSYVLFGDGKGSFSAPQLVPNSSELYPVYDSRRVADLNQDGRDDLFSNDYSDLYAYLSNGDGTFTTVTTTLASLSGQSGVSSSAAVADFNGDGKLDAVWVAGPNVVVCKGHGDGTFDSSCLNLPIPTSVSSNFAGAAVTAGDFDGDGNRDFAVLVNYSSSLGAQSAAFVFYGAGDGTFSSAVPAGQFDHSYTGIYSGDLNNDGLADLILKTSGSLGGGYAVGVVNSLPHRGFDSEVNYYAGTGLADISIADLNNDGFLDLVFSNGDYNVRASSVTVLMNNGKVPSSVTLSSSLNPAPLGGAVTFTASISSSLSVVEATDTVTFFDGQTQLGAVPVGPGLTATYSTSSLPVGSHSITAVYSGNRQILGSTSSALTESISYFVGDFSIQATPSTATVTSGQSATIQLAISPSGGFNAPLTFACSGLPAFATCAFSPSTLSSGQGQVSLNIQTAGATQSASLSPSSKLSAGGAAAVLAGLVCCLSRRKRFVSFFVFAIVSLLALLATSCGGGGSGGGSGSGNGNRTPAGNYQLTITAQTNEPSQNVSHSTTVGLTVQ